MTKRLPSSTLRKARNWALLILLPLLALSFAILSTAPSVDRQGGPTADEVAAAREVMDQVRTAQQAGAPVRLSLDARQIGAMAVLAGEVGGLARVEADVAAGVLTARASLPLVHGLWVNTAATIVGTHEGFPSIRVHVGRFGLPAISSQWTADLVRWWLARKGIELPALDELVRHVSVAGNAVSAQLVLPQRSGLMEQLVGAAGARVDERLVTQIHCQLARAITGSAEVPLTALVQQAFRGSTGPDVVRRNRAAFVAIAFHVVGEQAHRLAPAAATRIRNCPPPARMIVLRGRADLAKHWAFSAALTATLGEQTAENLTEWKELHDSLPAGSGFSFVDLAADRSGLHVARKGLDPRSAGSMARFLTAVTEEALLPSVLTRAPEGLSNAEFESDFGSLDQGRYRAAIARIDQRLGYLGR